jgi:nucleoid-associated protein YgaU
MKAGEVRDVVFRALPTRPAAKFQPNEEVPVVVAATPTATAPALPPLPRADKNWRAPVVHHYYTISPKDAGLMMIARYMYNDGTLWPKIWLANLDQVPDPGAIHSGIHLRIPDKAPLTAAEIAARDAYARRRR